MLGHSPVRTYSGGNIALLTPLIHDGSGLPRYAEGRVAGLNDGRFESPFCCALPIFVRTQSRSFLWFDWQSAKGNKTALKLTRSWSL